MVNFKLNAKNFRDEESMATAYLTAYFGNSEIEYPISPFKMLKDDIAIVGIKVEEKKGYIAALEKADTEKNYADLYECIFKVIIRSHVELSKNSL